MSVGLSASTTQTSKSPVRGLSKAIRLPFGDHDGFMSSKWSQLKPSSNVTRVRLSPTPSPLPSVASITNRSHESGLAPRPFDMNAILELSGDHVGCESLMPWPNGGIGSFVR